MLHSLLSNIDPTLWTKGKVAQLIAGLDDGSGKLTYNDLLGKCLPSGNDTQERHKCSVEIAAKAREVFLSFSGGSEDPISHAAAIKHFSSFGKVSTAAMFREVDENSDGVITLQEFLDFWRQVEATGQYDQEDLLEEMQCLKEGGSWVDYNDSRDTGAA
eukprot:TRINITY_DN16360_c0_g2_i1.p1 TRINITY_DN16360_c0_g2~~TRINITY_DN16360_c0_g2_i1.p1  ORF type:complete len:159 (-),score=32.12 TRINITY_DN16360_c0_g2_i1:69-545(-)